MKRYLIALAATLMAMPSFSQNNVITGHKAGDNWYVGATEGIVSTMGTDKNGKPFTATDFKGFYSDLGLRVGKNLTTVFGMALEADLMFRGGKKSVTHNRTFVSHSNVSLLGTFNLTNALYGYAGQPRQFEVTALTGFGWNHLYGRTKSVNEITSKIAFDFAMNMGQKNQYQVFVEPYILYVLDSWRSSVGHDEQSGLKYNLKNSHIGIKVGIVYKFPCSNGTHNFARTKQNSPTEITYLKARIIQLQDEVASKSTKIAEDAKTLEENGQTIADLKAKIEELEKK